MVIIIERYEIWNDYDLANLKSQIESNANWTDKE